VFRARKSTLFDCLDKENDDGKVLYADGFSRSLTNKAQSIIKSKIYNQVGTVTMDRIMFDVGSDNIKVNDDVILIGEKGKLKIDAWDWSNKINTIPYEVTCGISKRVPRVVTV
jgi:alanine racemase